MVTALRAGKTAPRIIEDLFEYDPRYTQPDSGNALTSIPFHDPSKHEVEDAPPPGSCRHQWSLKPNQSSLRAQDEFDVLRPGTIAAYCTKCRSHLKVSLRYTDTSKTVSPCPAAERPLHHFLHRPDQSGRVALEANKVTTRSSSSWKDVQNFQCSAAACAAQLSIEFRPPRLTSHWVSLLTDRIIIRSRAEQEIARDPAKFDGHAPPLPGTVLENLVRLINVSLQESGRKPYARDGRNYLLNFGAPCDDLMIFLGFTRDDDAWHWPQVAPMSEVPITNETNILLDDVREEINVLMLERPDDERRSAKFVFTPHLATKDLSQLLSCANYKRNTPNRTVDLTADEHPCYAGLGALADFHDDLIFFAYNSQIDVDIGNMPYYMECLQTLAGGRDSDELTMRATMEESKGHYSLQDLGRAYEHLNLRRDDQKLTDDVIIGTFRARLADAPRQEHDLRHDLAIIGRHRTSSKILNAAQRGVSTYEQALVFLEAEEDTTDEFITTMYMVKIDGNPSEESTARQAVALIANHRKSNALKHWLEHGVLGHVEMDIAQAYARLDIADRSADDEMVWTLFKLHIEEQPSQADELRQAISVIAKGRNSNLLMSYAGLESDASKEPINEWPAALTNIGNTCYLNSLLQFYFSLRPFRDLILHIDEYKMQITEDLVHSKRVGSRIVSKKEVERAQRTVDELKKLFTGMIKCPTRSFRPDTEVARLTLVTPKAEIIRRQSIRASMSSVKPNVAELREQASEASADLTSFHESPTEDDDIIMIDSPAQAKAYLSHVKNADTMNSSKETLVDAGSVSDEKIDLDNLGLHEQKLEKKQNIAPQKTGETATEAKAAALSDKLPPHGPEETLPTKAPTASAFSESGSSLDTVKVDAPRRPPPVPPRPQAKPSVEEEALREAEFAAEQQDVSEIKDNILFQVECAIRPESVDANGEQIDQIKDLFYGTQKSFITNKTGEIRSKDELISDIKVNVLKGSCDIYSALDGAFDVEDVKVAGGTEPKYCTMSRLPPVIQIHVQRAQYDPKTKKPFKSENHLQFDEMLYMDRYMDTSDIELINKRKQSWMWKQKLARLEERREQLVAADLNMDMSDVLNSTVSYLTQLQGIKGDHAIDVPQGLVGALQKASEDARVELEALEVSIANIRRDISTQFTELRAHAFRLAAVFIHRGSSSAGHYWVYIYDFKQQIWRNYNDEHVTKVANTGEIFDAPTGPRPPTPYFLVYVKDEAKDELIDPICRDVPEAVAVDEEAKDTPMQEYEPVKIDQSIADIYAPLQSVQTGAPVAESKGWDDSQNVKAGW